jgi:aminopeptidase N
MSSPNLTREEARERADLISDCSYEVSLDLTRDEETFGCETVIRFRASEPGSSTFVNFVGRSVDRVLLNGAEVPVEAFDGTRIRLEGLAAENELRITATCEFQHTGVGMHRFRDPVDGLVYTYSDAEPFDIHRVYPCFDQPDLKGRFDFSVVAPAGWEVVSNVEPVSRPTQGEAGQWTFARTPPMPTYITAIVAGPYHVARTQHRNLDLGLYCRQSLAPYLETDEIFEVTKQGFDFFEQAFDYPYAFGGKYDQIFVPEFNSGAMENVGCVTFHEDYLFRSKVTDAARERRAETILHEMAHMWFGDLVTMRWWDDLWLNESFASWAAVYSQANATRWGHAWVTFADSEKTWAYRQDQLASTHPIVADIPDIAATKVNFDGITYAKGASVLRQLVAWVGEEAFLAGIRAYFRRHEFSNTTLQDFLSALEESSGRDLGLWSKEWLETAGVNTLRPRIETVPVDGGEAFASLWVEQEAPPEHPTLRSHRLGIGLYDAGPDGIKLRRGIELDVVGRATPVEELEGERVPDLLLLNDGDLTFAKIRLDERSVSTIVQRLAEVRDPLARALCWGAAWDMTRDAEIPARRYLELVLRNIRGELVIPVVQSLLAQASSAVLVYGHPSNRGPGLDEFSSAALRAIEGADPGSDHQLAWTRSFIANARSDEHLAIVRGLLDGTTSFDGVPVDTDLRWLIVRSLAAVGAATEELIAAEEARDPTDKGKREATTARAAIPTTEAKEAAWKTIVEDTTLPFAMIRALIGGFQRSEHEHLMEPFVARYFETLQPFWDRRNLEEALAFANGLYPRVLVSEDTVKATDDYIASRAPGPALRRVLIEGRDDVQRALRARAADANA